MQRIYLDNAATSPMFREVADEIYRIESEYFGNPSSRHAEGARAAELLSDARNRAAVCLGCLPEEIVFTSGGSESDNLAIRGALEAGKKRGKNRFLTTSIEHRAVLRAAAGFTTDPAPVDREGYVSPYEIANRIDTRTAVVSVMLANNETGAIQPVREVAAVCREHGVLFHTDAVQAAGHMKINAHELGVDMLSLSAHKFHGPKGIGALYIRKGTQIESLIRGGDQENGFLAGTENVSGACGMALALELSTRDIEEKSARINEMRGILAAAFGSAGGAYIAGGDERLPGIINVCFAGVSGESLAALLDMRGIAVSSGSACESATPAPSRVLTAMGVPEELARCAVRFSVSELNTRAEIEYAARAAVEAVRDIRSAQQISRE